MFKPIKRLRLVIVFLIFIFSLPSFIIAIVDDAVMIDHINLAANVTPGQNVMNGDDDPNPPFDGPEPITANYFSHGTSVAGVAGAVTNNGEGTASMGWNNTIMPIRATNIPSQIESGYDAGT